MSWSPLITRRSMPDGVYLKDMLTAVYHITSLVTGP